MAKSLSGWYWHLGLASFIGMSGAIATSFNCASAQIIPDSTLPNNSIVTPQGNTSIIEDGTQEGRNLFHSFEQFSVPTGGEAYFNNASNIQNIFSRVTGGSVSNIDGLLRANGTANLFLLNPSGIIFGPNATLNIGGSFVGSTASSLNFADGTSFSATAPTSTPLLTVSVPIGLQYGGTAGGIQVQQSILRVQPGQTLALMGGDVSVSGGGSGFLRASGGRVELGAVAGAGTVGLNFDGNNLSLSYPTSVQRADVSLTNEAFVSVTAGGGGSIAVNARNLDVLGGSTLSAGIGTGLGSVDSQSGDITLNATGAITVAGSDIFNLVRTGSVGNGGNINITTGSLSLTNDVLLQAITYGQGNAGSVNINARDTVSFDGGEAVSVVAPVAVGNSGNINVTAGSLKVTNGATLSANTYGQGNAGSVNINVRDTVSFDGVGSDGLLTIAASQVGPQAVGNGGNINITTGSLSVTNRAQLGSSTFGQGDAGSVNINARDTVSLDGDSVAVSAVDPVAVGNGGSVNITTGSLYLSNGGELLAFTGGRGNGGSVNINARDTVSFDGVGGNASGVFNTADPGAVGNGGSVSITTGSLYLTNGGRVSVASRNLAQGNAGSVTINARDTVSLDGVGSNGAASSVNSIVETEAFGNGGSIDIMAESLSLTDGAELSASSEGNGAAGNIKVAADSIRLDNQVVISSDTPAGQGNIELSSQDLVLRRGSNITTNAEGTATGGNITIDTDVLAAIENSDISADSDALGGQVIITASGIFGTEYRARLTPLSDITATGGSPELSGSVEINRLDVDPTQGLVELPAEIVDASNQIAQACPSGVREGKSKFIVTGRGGLPPSPHSPLTGDRVLTNLATLDNEVENISSPDEGATNPTQDSAATPIVEATGWMFNKRGQVVLTATAPTAINIPWLPKSNCNAPKPSSDS